VIRLGLRLASLGGRWSLVPTALTALAVAFGTSILLFALSFQPALEVRYDRGAWRETPGVRDATLFGDSIHLLVGADVSETALRAAAGTNGSTEIREKPPSLEDVFVTLSRRAAGELK